MPALALTAVGCPRWETSITLAADHLVAVEFRSQDLERGLNNATTKTEDEMEGGFLLDVVIGKSAAILKLLASKDQALLVRGDALLVLDFGLDIVDSIR